MMRAIRNPIVRTGVLVTLTWALTACPDQPPVPEPSIPFFGRDHAVVTRGTALDGNVVEGEVTLTWQTLQADDIRILANDEPLDLSDCEPTLGGDCHEDGMVTHRPTEDTVYTLQAIRDGGDCTLGADGRPSNRSQCAVHETSVAVRPPARASLEGPSEPVLSGSDVSVDYAVENAETFQIGRVRIEGGERVFEPCAGESDADENSRCVLPEDDGVPAASGTLSLPSVSAGVTLAVIADNGASDGLGRVRDGDLEISVDVLGHPILSAFEVDPDTVLPFGDVTLSWETENAVAVSVAVSPSDAVDSEALGACGDVDPATGAGECTVTVGLGDEDGRVVFTAVAIGPTFEESAARTATVDVEDDPQVETFEIEEQYRRAGQPVTLSWTTVRAVGVVLSVEPEAAVSAAALDGCTDVDDEGEGGCVVTLAGDTEPGIVTFSLRAEGVSGVLSDPVTRVVSVGVAPDPTLVADPSQLPVAGGDVTLTWTAAGAGRIALYDTTDDPEVLIRECTAEDDLCEPTGDSYVVDDVTTNRSWRIVATNDFGDGAATTTVTVAGQPEVLAVAVDGEDALASPAIVPAATAGLSWSTNAETTSTTLERAGASDVAGDPCGSVASGDWEAVAGFPGDPQRDAADPWVVSDLDGDLCFRLTAYNVTNDLHRRSFRVVRQPVVDAFTVSPSNADRGAEFTLAWETRFAGSVAVTVAPDMDGLDLSTCNAVDAAGEGSCTLTVPAGAIRRAYVFSLVAHGPAESTSETALAAFEVSQRPFNVSIVPDAPTLPADTVDDGAVVTLTWSVSSNTDTIVLSAEPPVDGWPETINLDEDFEGTKEAEIFVTTTFTLTATNVGGDTVSTTTVHVDPRIETLVAEDRYAHEVDAETGGTHDLVTGEVTVAWTSSNGTFSQLAHADPVTNCATVPPELWVPVQVQSDPDDANDWDLDAHRCFRLLVFNDYVPEDESEQRPLDVRFFRLRNMPHVVDMDGPESGQVQNANPQPIDIEMWIDAATTLELRAQYLDEDGNPVIAATDFVCNEGSLFDGELVGDPGEVDHVTCRHTPDPYTLGECLRATNDCVPASTHTIDYILTVDDGGGPAVTVHSVDYDAGVRATP